MPTTTVADLLFLAGVVVLATVATLRDRGGDGGPSDPIERVQRAYERDEIAFEALERRVEVLTDPDRRAVYDLVRRVDYAGHDVALRVAREYTSLDAVAAADRSELAAVHGVGPSTAGAILQDVSA